MHPPLYLQLCQIYMFEKAMFATTVIPSHEEFHAPSGAQVAESLGLQSGVNIDCQPRKGGRVRADGSMNVTIKVPKKR